MKDEQGPEMLPNMLTTMQMLAYQRTDILRLKIAGLPYGRRG